MALSEPTIQADLHTVKLRFKPLCHNDCLTPMAPKRCIFEKCVANLSPDTDPCHRETVRQLVSLVNRKSCTIIERIDIGPYQLYFTCMVNECGPRNHRLKRVIPTSKPRATLRELGTIYRGACTMVAEEDCWRAQDAMDRLEPASCSRHAILSPSHLWFKGTVWKTYSELRSYEYDADLFYLLTSDTFHGSFAFSAQVWKQYLYRFNLPFGFCDEGSKEMMFKFIYNVWASQGESYLEKFLFQFWPSKALFIWDNCRYFSLIGYQRPDSDADGLVYKNVEWVCVDNCEDGNCDECMIRDIDLYDDYVSWCNSSYEYDGYST